ncbi:MULTISPECIES: ribbon-helix-helix domain-containing protein [Acetobacter]|uniref:Ribbon-helix-helix domain-containing protein n=2 Tax=Acetobacter TaxID=434 RepID=A0AAN1PJF9_9PROT|nr:MULTISPECIES: ribbon-helix-helix domain-containing protein [Acetobacter]ASL39181.1 hypothetical protein CBI36_01140 [Acetobacter oryzifermentans]ATI12095.1 hypothetical protein CPF11_06210 [Acetobacter pomorum]AXC25542.1 hypothetical protein DS739_01230 [Acetobacter sp. JWB]AXN01305.1 hypothetical protein CJF59_12710 [Acetobacter pomorum]KAA8395098.1 ribbon-helix-helix domain-containing protein [Acetobacter sp. DmW_125128]
MSRHLRKRSLILAGHDTSVALEPTFWDVLEDIANQQAQTLPQIVTKVDAARSPEQSLASALRVYALEWLKQQLTTHAIPSA